MKLNLNNQVNVVLTDYGLEVIKEYYKDLKQEYTGGKILKCPMWEMCQIFGSKMYIGTTKNVFENNEVVVEKDVF